jgi:hypothetical protein
MADNYNGWSNYETWLVKLWMDNDEISYHCYLQMARESINVYELSKELEQNFDDCFPLEKSSVYTDLLNSALKEVDWYEIAESLMEEIKEESEEN